MKPWTKLPHKHTVQDVMTAPVLTVTESTGFKEIVQILETQRISAVPVVDPLGKAVGIVSEADLLLKPTDGAGRPTHRLFKTRKERIERTKSGGLVAWQLMSAPVIAIEPEATLGSAARLMHEKQVKRLPVVDKEGKLLGIVSRADVLKVFLRPDAEIRREVIEGVLIHTLWMDPAGVEVTVTQGVVCLEGTVDRRSDIPFLVRLVTAVDGVVGVHESLSFRFDDLHADSRLPWAASGAR